MAQDSHSQALLGPRSIIAWVVALVAGGVLLGWLYPRVFPLAPSGWEVTRGQAIEIAEERLRDLGEPVADPYVTATLVSDPLLESRLSESDASPALLAESELADALYTWRVSVYRRDSLVGDWAYLVTVALDGRVLSLLRGAPPNYQSDAILELEPAVDRASRFLSEQGFDLSRFGEPTERRIDLARFAYLFVRYPALDRPLGAVFDHGVEVRFFGDQLQGFHSWHQDAEVDRIQRDLRPTTLVQTARIFVIFLFLPFLMIVFVRRYHEGLVGVRRGGSVFGVIFLCCTIVLLMTARAAVEGSSAGNTTRPQMTWLWTMLMLVVYFPALASVGFIGSSVGESWSRGRWRARLAAFDALFRGEWRNATVAAASLRGVASGLLLAAAILLLTILLERLGASTLFSFQLGPWWHNASLPGVAMVLTYLAFSLAYICVGLLFLLPALAARFGTLTAGVMVSLISGMLFFPPVQLMPIHYGAPVWLLAAAAMVVLYCRYGLVTALLASLVSSVVLGAMPLVQAVNPSLQLQGWIALAGASLPLWVSAWHLGSQQGFRYEYDDVPPHVQRIAERERQRVELETARRIQSSILPQLPSQLHQVGLAHTYLPASEVGGDFYDVLGLDDGRLAIAIGDVAGHGVSSGLIMCMARSALSVQVGFCPEVEEVFRTLNQVVYKSARRRLLTTLCYAILDPQSRRLEYASAGHLYPYRISGAGQVDALESIAYPLGVREQLRIEPRSRELEPGDAIFLSSDGLVESRRHGGDEQFGFERLEESLERSAGQAAEVMMSRVLDDVERFVGGGAPMDPALRQREDDLTVLVLRLAE